MMFMARKVAEGDGRLHGSARFGRLQKVAEGCGRSSASRYPSRTPGGSLRGISRRATGLTSIYVNGVPSHMLPHVPHISE